MAVVVDNPKSVSCHLAPGNEVSCTTVYGEKLRGNVMATDEVKRVMIIRESDGSSQPVAGHGGGTVHIVNLQHISELTVTAVSPSGPSSLPPINLSKVQRRIDTTIQTRLKEISARGVNVSKQAQQLFDTIHKVYEQIQWDGSDIVVLGEVKISPPYCAENCSGTSSAAERIRMLVTKFHEGQQK